MKILFDQGTPAPLRHVFTGHAVSTAYEMGWALLANGESMRRARLRRLQPTRTSHTNRISGTPTAILILPTTSWPKLKDRVRDVEAALATLEPGSVVRLPVAP